MIELTLGNSYSTIQGLTPEQEKELKALLSYTVGGSAAYFSGYGVRRRSLLSKRGEFPSGLIHRVKPWAAKWGFMAMHSNIAPNHTGSILPQDVEGAYDWQIDALIAAYGAPTGIITAPTGSGKSRVMYMIAKTFGMKCLIVVPSLEIKQQLSKDFKDLSRVTIENIDSPRLSKLTNFDVLILDEAHKSAARRYHKLNRTAWTGIYHRYCFTATPFRNDNEETLLFESIAGEVIYKYSYDQAVKDNTIVPVTSYYINIPKQKTNAFTWAQVYSELVVNNTLRNVIIANLLTSLHSAQKYTLCLVKEVEHGRILSELTGLPFVSGADDDSRKYIERFKKGEIKVLIGTYGIISEGVDTRPAEYVLVAGLGKAKSAFMQTCGRATRNYENKDSAKILILKDLSHKFTARHFNAQKKILVDEYNSIPVKLDM